MYNYCPLVKGCLQNKNPIYIRNLSKLGGGGGSRQAADPYFYMKNSVPDFRGEGGGGLKGVES